jgi:hypothetical protein
MEVKKCMLTQILITATGSAIGAGTGLYSEGGVWAGAAGAVLGGLLGYVVAPPCLEIKQKYPGPPVAKRELPPGGRPSGPPPLPIGG